MKKRLAIIQGTRLSQGAERLLRFIIARYSIGREDWIDTPCYPGKSNDLPAKKHKRLAAMEPHRIRVTEFIRANSPCVVVGMGQLACETLTGASVLGSRAGTWWQTDGFGKVWITQSPEAALYDPTLAVDISAVLNKAAEAAGIETRFDHGVPMFNWEPYEKFIFSERSGTARRRNG